MTASGVMIMSEPLQTVAINVTVNGKAYQHNVEPRQLLVEFIREELRLTGTHIGCDTSYCGACTVLLDGAAIKSCTLFAVQADGAEITTVEALEKEGQIHPLQQAFSEQHGLQCGYCTPGMLMSSVALLAETPEPEIQDIRKALSGNVCRCTGYQNIIKSVQAAATVLATRWGQDFLRLRVPATESIVAMVDVPVGVKKTSEGASSAVCNSNIVNNIY